MNRPYRLARTASRHQDSEDAVKLCNTGCAHGFDCVSRCGQEANGAQGFAPLRAGQPKDLIHQGVRDRLGICEIESDQSKDLQARPTALHSQNTIEDQSAGTSRTVPGEHGSPVDGLPGKGVQFVAPGSFVEWRMTEPGQDEPVGQFI